jgi:hypothetical protein
MASSFFDYSGSSQLSKPVELDYGNQFQASNFPSWMQQQAPIGSLKRGQKQLGNIFGGAQQQIGDLFGGAQAELGRLFDFAPIQQAGNAYINSNFEQQRAATGAAARAAQNRAMLSGGRVGSSFAQASAMLPLYNQRNQQALGLAQLQGQMRGQQAGLSSNLTGQQAGLTANLAGQRAGLNTNLAQSIAQSRLANRGLLSDYAMGQQRLGQDQRQFDQRLQMDQQGLDLQRAQFNAANAARAMQAMGPGGFVINRDRMGNPSTPYDWQQDQRRGLYEGQRQALMGQMLNPY